jgi:hypothetical protein
MPPVEARQCVKDDGKRAFSAPHCRRCSGFPLGETSDLQVNRVTRVNKWIQNDVCVYWSLLVAHG